MTKVRSLVLMVGAVALIFVILALQLLAPGDKLDQVGPGNAHVVFSADRSMVIAPGACVTVRWQVDHIQKVFLDTLPTVGQGFKLDCIDNQTMPVLHVVFQDGTTQDYPLNVKFFIEQPLVWFLAWIGLLLLLLSLYAALSRSTTPLAIRDTVRRTPRRGLFFAAIGLLFSGMVIIALPLELGLHLYFGQFGTREEQTAYLLSRDEIQARESDLTVLPLIEFGLLPDYPGHNRLGYRGGDIQVPKPAGVYRIVVLGDSTTYGVLVPYDKTYPADLQQILRDDYGYKNLEVVNGGVPTYTSWNILMDLAFRVQELQPDLVIVYTAGNDLGARAQSPDCYSSPSPFLGLDATRHVRVQPADLSRSALFRFLAISFGWMQNPSLEDETVTISTGTPCSPEVISEIPQNLQANPPIYFERNLREMIGVSKALGIRIMFMSWAYSINSPYFPEVQRPHIAEHNAITARVTQQNGTLFFDYAPLAPTNKISWADAVHVNVRGSLEQAQDIARFLVDQNVLPQQKGS